MRYFVVKVEQQYVANRYASAQFTEDEEQAFAYTSYEEALAAAMKFGGIVVEQAVTQDELDELHFEKIDVSAWMAETIFAS